MNLSMLRKQAGVTQKDVAHALGVAQSTVSMWETGRNFPRVHMLSALAGVLHCTVNELLALADDEEQDQIAKGA